MKTGTRLRLAASLKAGAVAPSVLMKRLAAYPKQNALARTIREIGRLARTLFTLDWISDPALRRLGEIRDRTLDKQRDRASGLNLAVAAIILWNTVYLARGLLPQSYTTTGDTIRP